MVENETFKVLEFALKGFTYTLMAFAYFVHGGLDGVFGVFVLSTMLALSALIGFVPFVGYWGARTMMFNKTIPWSLAYTGLSESWITHWMVTYSSLVALVFCAASTIAFIYYGGKLLIKARENQRRAKKWAELKKKREERKTAAELEKDAGITL
jgi:hypothetical protein